MSQNAIPQRPFGRTGIEVTSVGLGGEGVLRTFGRESAAQTVILEALSQGIGYFDSANAYAGSESYYGLVWPNRPDDRVRVFQTSKSARRDGNGASTELDNTLKTMGIDHLDLWQIHDVRTHQDIDRIAGPAGALEAFVTARAAGKTQFIGVTGHDNPEVLTRAINEWPVDSVMMPVNPVEVTLGGFMDTAMAAAARKGVAVIGMKVLGASHYLSPDSGVTAELLIRFALSQPISVAIVGCANAGEVQTLAAAGRQADPLAPDVVDRLVEAFRPYARRLAYYRGVF